MAQAQAKKEYILLMARIDQKFDIVSLANELEKGGNSAEMTAKERKNRQNASLGAAPSKMVEEIDPDYLPSMDLK